LISSLVALPSGWPSNNTNKQPIRSFLAYLAFRSIFFRLKAPAVRAYISFLSQSAFFSPAAARKIVYAAGIWNFNLRLSSLKIADWEDAFPRRTDLICKD
jgi:hypothetical protein